MYELLTPRRRPPTFATGLQCAPTHVATKQHPLTMIQLRTQLTYFIHIPYILLTQINMKWGALQELNQFEGGPRRRMIR